MARSGSSPWIRDALVNAPIEGSGGVRYHLRTPLGEGGQGFLYRANYDEPDGFFVVVKLLRPDVGNEDAHTRFQREAEVLRKLGQMEVPNPHIVRYYDHALLELSGPGRERVVLPFTVLEYISGPTLADLLLQQPGYGLAVGRVRRIFRQLARALTAVHAAKIVHRDLKPSNVLIAREHGHDVVKITDFGLVKRFDVDLRATIAIAGASVGYAPPEQFEQGNKRVSNKTDLFAFCAMLFEALTGAAPFSQSIDETSMQVISRMMTGGAPRIAHHLHRAAPELATRGDAVLALDELLARALSPNPDERPDSAMALWEALEAPLRMVELPPERSPGSMRAPALVDETSVSVHSTAFVGDVDVNSVTSHQLIYESDTRAVSIGVSFDPLSSDPTRVGSKPGTPPGLQPHMHKSLNESVPNVAARARPKNETAPVYAMRAPPVFPDSPTPGGYSSFPPSGGRASPLPSLPAASMPRVDALGSTQGAPPSAFPAAPPMPRVDVFASTHGPQSSALSEAPADAEKRGLGSTAALSARSKAAYVTSPTAVRPAPLTYAPAASISRAAFAPRVRVITASTLPERARAACFSPDGGTIFALGYRGAYVLDGTRWTRLEGLSAEQAARARGILCTPAREIVVYGDGGFFGGLAWGGALREWTRGDPDITWISASLATNEILLVGNHTSRDLPVVGSLGVGAPLAIRVVEHCPRLLGGTRLRSGSLLGVSVAGDPVCVASDGVVPVSWPRTGSLRTAVATSDGGAFVVGLGGHVLRVDARLSASLEAVHTTKDLYQVVVSESGVAWAGGVSASLVRRSPQGWLRVHLPDATTGAVLTIAATDYKARVVLDDGVVVEAESDEVVGR